jgi:hypothetical protein
MNLLVLRQITLTFETIIIDAASTTIALLPELSPIHPALILLAPLSFSLLSSSECESELETAAAAF